MARQFWKSLTAEYRDLRRVFDDLSRVNLRQVDWNSLVPAPHVGELEDESDAKIEAWFLAEDFLFHWCEWRELLDRYLLLFHGPESKVPDSWIRFRRKCERLANELMADRRLGTVLNDHHNEEAEPEALVDANNKLSLDEDVDAWLDAICDAHRNHRLAHIKTSDEGFAWQGPNDVKGDVTPRQVMTRIALAGNKKILSRYKDVSRTARNCVAWHLNCYRNATLTYSWLPGPNGSTVTQHSALESLLSERQPVDTSIETFLSSLNKEHRTTAEILLKRLRAAMSEMGFENLFADVTSSDFFGGVNSPVGVDQINIIPGNGGDRCCAMLLALSRGNKGAMAMPRIMPKVREHLIRCEETKVVVVICDHWHPSILDDSLGELQAWHEKGVRFLFLLVGSPDTNFAPIPVVLEDL